MKNANLEKDTYSKAETEARREAALKELLATPRKPMKAKSKKRRESSQSK